MGERKAGTLDASAPQAPVDAAADPETSCRRIKYGLFISFIRGFGLPLWLVNLQLAPLYFAHPTRELFAEMARIGMRRPHDSFIHSAQAVVTHRQSLVQHLGEISVPALLIFGRKDRAVHPGSVGRLSQGIRGAKVVFIKGAGHMAAIEAPSEVSSRLVPFVHDQLTRGTK